jgi:hypothetical protein
MNLYNLGLFFHVICAIGYSGGVLVTILGLVALRRASRVEQVRTIVGLIGLSDPVAIVSALLILGAGVYMTFTAWGWQQGWINTALGTVILIAALGATVIESRRKVIAKLAKEAPDGPLPDSLHERIHDPVLGTALYTLTALLLGIIFLMTYKPVPEQSILVIVICGITGLLSSLPLWRGARPKGKDAAQGKPLV